MPNLSALYSNRLGKDQEFRKRMYKALCSGFFQNYVERNGTVLEIGAGYCEFINCIKAKKKIALDLNPDVSKYAAKGVRAIASDSTDMHEIKSGSVDTAYASNFFEHLSKPDIEKTLCEISRVLRKGGRLIIVQPNIRYCCRDYWMFFDHITPLDDRSMREALELHGFSVAECRPRFLPYSTKSRLPKSVFLLNIYLRVAVLQRIFGRQMFILAEK